MNYMGIHIDIMMQHLAINLPSDYPSQYTYIPTWDDLWAEHQSGVSGSGGGGDRDDQ